MNDFSKDLKQWVSNSAGCWEVRALYEKCAITMRETLELIARENAKEHGEACKIVDCIKNGGRYALLVNDDGECEWFIVKGESGKAEFWAKDHTKRKYTAKKVQRNIPKEYKYIFEKVQNMMD